MATKKARAGLRSFQITDKAAGGTLSFDVGGTATVELSGEVRTSLESATNPAPGYSATMNRGRLEAEVLDGNDVSLATMMNWIDVTAIATSVTGKTYAADGWLTEKPTLDLLTGTISIVIEGIVSEEIFG